MRHNLIYKILALGIALVLWFYVNSERNPQSHKTFAIPIEAVNLADGYVAELSTREASVGIAGLKSSVDAVSRENVGASVNLAGIKAGNRVIEKTVKVNARVKESEGDLEITTNPKTVKARIEALGGKRLPVEVKFPTVPPLGYSYSNPMITPASVGVSGRLSQVTQVRRIILTLPNRTPSGSIDGDFKVTAVDAKGAEVDGVELDVEKARLKLDLLEVPATKTVIVSPDVTGVPKFPAKVTRVSVTPSLVTLEGRPHALSGVSTVDTDQMSIDGAENTVTRDMRLRLPAGVKVVGRGRVKVTVYIAVPQ